MKEIEDVNIQIATGGNRSIERYYEGPVIPIDDRRYLVNVEDTESVYDTPSIGIPPETVGEPYGVYSETQATSKIQGKIYDLKNGSADLGESEVILPPAISNIEGFLEMDKDEEQVIFRGPRQHSGELGEREDPWLLFETDSEELLI